MRRMCSAFRSARCATSLTNIRPKAYRFRRRAAANRALRPSGFGLRAIGALRGAMRAIWCAAMKKLPAPAIPQSGRRRARAARLRPSARADTYPSRPVHLLVGFPAGWYRRHHRPADRRNCFRSGSASPSSLRTAAPRGNSIAAESVARASPDGYTLLFIANPNVINAMLNPARFDLMRDFAPVGGIDRNPRCWTSIRPCR